MSEDLTNLKDLREKRLLAFKNGQWDDVIRVCEQVLTKRPQDPLASHDLCVAYWRQGNRNKSRFWALKTCEAFVGDQAHTSVENQMRHMLTLMQAGKASPRYLRHYEVLGEILYEEGAFEAARDYFEQLIPLKGHFSRKYIYVFKCDLHLKSYLLAKQQYSRMAQEFPGREGHLLVSSREYVNRHYEDNGAVDLYVNLMDEAGVRNKEFEKLKEKMSQEQLSPEDNALMRAHYRFFNDIDEEYKLVKACLNDKPDLPPLLHDLARLSLKSDPEKGVKALVRSFQMDPNCVHQVKVLIRRYLETTPRPVQENLCKGILALLDEATARELMLDMAADLPTHELLQELRSQWTGTDTSVALPSDITSMLENLSLTELIKAKMKMEEHIASMKGETTFLALDIAGSTRLKEGESLENVMVTFEGFHKLVDRSVKAQGGEVFHSEGDGKIARFSRTVDAVRAAREVFKALEEFNEKGNKVHAPILIRVGLHSGLSLIDKKTDHTRVADRILDVACHLEKYGIPGEIHLSEEAVKAAKLVPDEVVKLGWREKSGVMAYKLM